MKKRSFNRHTYYVIVHIVKLWFFPFLVGSFLIAAWVLTASLILLAQDKLGSHDFGIPQPVHLQHDSYGWFAMIFIYSGIVYFMTGFLVIKKAEYLNYGVYAMLISLFPSLLVLLIYPHNVFSEFMMMGYIFVHTEESVVLYFAFFLPFMLFVTLLGMKTSAEYRERFYTKFSCTEKPEEITVEPPYPTRI